jgi:hypothetical protein
MRFGIVLAAAFVTLASLAPLGCGPKPEPHVARGELYTTGNDTFDNFFSAVKEVREAAKSGPDDVEAAHQSLVKALGLDAAAGPEKTLDGAGKSAKKLQEKGVLLHLEIAPEPKLLATRGKVDVGADGEALLKAMEGSVKTSLDTRKKLEGIANRAADLEKRRAELRDQAADAFKGEAPGKRDEILAELDASKAVLADAGEGARSAAGAAARFAVDLVQAVETGGYAEPVKPGKGGKKGGPTGPARGGGGGKAAAPAGPAAPPPPPKKKGKGGDDFEP